MTAHSHSGGRKRRRLTEDEHRLWRGVTRSVKPLRPGDAAAPESDSAVHEPIDSARAQPSDAIAARKRAPAASPPLAPLARRDKQRLARGSMTIDARIDLHGMTQDRAHAALLRFLRRAQTDEAKFVLVITGKGARADPHGERGVLRRQVPLWLSLAEFRAYVTGFEDAHIAHGGAGALYVRVRRGRD
jgi:DNA-nicking Smr family endonuclease